MILTVAALLTVVLGALWARTLLGLRESLQKNGLKLRGMIKFYAREEVSPESRPLFRTWFLFSWGFSFCAWVTVILITLHSDYNFWIGIFPILWYFVLFRYFFWEKSDLTDEPGRAHADSSTDADS